MHKYQCTENNHIFTKSERDGLGMGSKYSVCDCCLKRSDADGNYMDNPDWEDDRAIRDNQTEEDTGVIVD